ncbi:MAG: hypothetical protein ACQES8_04560 [Thermodesulfobacteriota bacterium]
MILLVNDANIFIDLLKIDLLESFFRLHYEFHVTDFVIGEVQEEKVEQLYEFINNGDLRKKSFNYEELTEIQLLEVEYRQLSIPDCSCLYYTRSLNARLLTGDGQLRKTAEQLDIPVHGILWVLDQLVAQEIISKREAHDKLADLLSINSRLPEAACRSRLKKWKKE